MKSIELLETEHKNLNNAIKSILGTCQALGITFNFKLSDRMAERGLTVRDVSNLTGLRTATISDLMLGKKSALNIHHIAIIMFALRISNLNDIFEIHCPTEYLMLTDLDSQKWRDSGKPPKLTKTISQNVNYLKSTEYNIESSVDNMLETYNNELNELTTTNIY